jgi:membrane protein involved in colicin uptake
MIMTHEEYINYPREARVPGTCPTCGGDPATGNDWFCAACFAEVTRLSKERYQARQAEAKAKRSAAAKAAAETRKLADGSEWHDGKRTTRSFASRVAGMRKYHDIRTRMANRF